MDKRLILAYTFRGMWCIMAGHMSTLGEDMLHEQELTLVLRSVQLSATLQQGFILQKFHNIYQ